MVLNTEFWEALTGAQRRRFAKANCEATYKKAIMYQILATLLGAIGIGLFLPVADTANRYWKGYHSLREEEMPVSVKIMSGINFVLGLFANVVILLMHRKEDYGMFVNTLTRRRLEAMLNETENVAVSTNESDDPFRIGNFATEKVIETRPMRQGCENFPSAAMLAISVAIIVGVIVLFSMLFSGSSGNDSNEDGSNNGSSNPSSSDVSSAITKEQFGELTVYPNKWDSDVSMQITATDGLKLRKGPTTKDDIITKMADRSEIVVLNYDEYENWYFVSYTQGGKTLYGWACARSGEDVYISPMSNGDDVEDTSSTESSEDAKNLLTKAQLKEMAASHIQAVIDVENDFVSYVKCDNTDMSSAVFFGDDSVGVNYFKVTNVANSADIKDYLNKYFVSVQATKHSGIEVVNDDQKSSVPENPVVSYNGALYVSSISEIDIEIDMNTFEVLSSSEKSYVTTVSGVSGDKNIVKFTINFQYVDEVLLVTSYSRS